MFSAGLTSEHVIESRPQPATVVTSQPGCCDSIGKKKLTIDHRCRDISEISLSLKFDSVV